MTRKRTSTRLKTRSSGKHRHHKGMLVPEQKVSGRDTLLKAARHLFALHGLSGTSIRDIAKAADTNSSQISYYFKNKEGLYRACLTDIAENRLKMATQILTAPNSKEEYRVRLKLFAENLMSYFLEDRDTGLIIIREYDRIHSPAEDIFQAYISNLFQVLTSFFQSAQKNDIAKFSAGPLVIASLFFSMITNELRIDHLRDRLYNKSLRNIKYRQIVIDQILDLIK